MDNQKEQVKQKLNQEVEYTSDFDESVNEQEKTEKLAANQLNKSEEVEQAKKVKRSRKTLEQEIADLDARRERLMEKKRRQEAHEKIVFGSTVIAMLKEMKGRNDRNGPVICKTILAFTEVEQPKNLDIIKKIISEI